MVLLRVSKQEVKKNKLMMLEMRMKRKLLTPVLMKFIALDYFFSL